MSKSYEITGGPSIGEICDHIKHADDPEVNVPIYFKIGRCLPDVEENRFKTLSPEISRIEFPEDRKHLVKFGGRLNGKKFFGQYDLVTLTGNMLVEL